MTTSVHALLRAVRRMTTDAAVAVERRAEMLDYDRLQEIEYQKQVPVSGTADQAMYWRTLVVEFDVEFFHAPEQRDSPLTMPHFTYGSVISGESESSSNETGAVLIHAQVAEWTTDDRDAIIGAQVAVGVTALDGECEYSGYLHLSFQGYGAPAEDSEVGDDPE